MGGELSRSVAQNPRRPGRAKAGAAPRGIGLSLWAAGGGGESQRRQPLRADAPRLWPCWRARPGVAQPAPYIVALTHCALCRSRGCRRRRRHLSRMLAVVRRPCRRRQRNAQRQDRRLSQSGARREGAAGASGASGSVCCMVVGSPTWKMSFR